MKSLIKIGWFSLNNEHTLEIIERRKKNNEKENGFGSEFNGHTITIVLKSNNNKKYKQIINYI